MGAVVCSQRYAEAAKADLDLAEEGARPALITLTPAGAVHAIDKGRWCSAGAPPGAKPKGPRGLKAPKGPPVKQFGPDVLYAMRTSGSTSGVPRFVAGRCSSTLNRLLWGWRELPFRPTTDALAPLIPSNLSLDSGAVEGPLVCRRSPLVFVDAVAEVLGSLLGGVALWIPSVEMLTNYRLLTLGLARDGVVSWGYIYHTF